VVRSNTYDVINDISHSLLNYYTVIVVNDVLESYIVDEVAICDLILENYLYGRI